jgi:hypothetical protein
MDFALIFGMILKRIRNESGSINNGSRGQNKSKMYKYLLLKSLCDMISALVIIPSPAYDCCTPKSYSIIVWKNVFDFYITYVFKGASGFFEVAATLDCALSIETNRFQWLQKKLYFCITTFLIFVSNFLFELFSLLSYTIKKYTFINKKKNETSIGYFSVYSKFALKKKGTVNTLLFVDSLTRDVLIFLINLALNIFILFKIRNLIKKRKTMINQSNGNNNVKSKKTLADQAEKSKIKMMFSLFLVYFIGHFPMFIIYSFFAKQHLYYTLSLFLLRTSYVVYFFVYFFFNKHFKMIVLEKLPFLRSNSINS